MGKPVHFTLKIPRGRSYLLGRGRLQGSEISCLCFSDERSPAGTLSSEKVHGLLVDILPIVRRRWAGRFSDTFQIVLVKESRDGVTVEIDGWGEDQDGLQPAAGG